jgi:hypothetical protein
VKLRKEDAMALDERYIQEAADRVMIKDLLARYGWAVDHGTPEDFANNFVEDGLVELPEIGIQLKGREEIKGLCASIQKLVPGIHHVMSNFVIDVDGDRAHGFCELNEFLLRPEAVYPNLQGWYEDDYVRRAGKWYIVHRRIHLPVPEVMSSGKVGEYFKELLDVFESYTKK